MRTILAIIGALAIFAVIVIALLIVFGLNAIKPLTAEATAYADNAVPAIAAEWNGAELENRASPELLDVLTAEILSNVMTFGDQNLGALQQYHGASCLIVDFQFTKNDGEFVQASCEARAEHEHGDAGYTLDLIKRNDAWSLLSFYVVPDEIRETDDRTRTVFNRDNALSSITVSFKEGSIGLTSNARLSAGADISGFEKIENIPSDD